MPRMDRGNHSAQASPFQLGKFRLSLRTAFALQSHERTINDSISSTTSSRSCSPNSSPGGMNISSSPSGARSRSASPLAFCSPSSRRLGSFLLRRRPSAVDLALSEERSRCSEDSIEKRGIGLMEPRPVDPIPTAMDMEINMLSTLDSRSDEHHLHGHPLWFRHQPTFVMGGIFEVMEGQA